MRILVFLLTVVSLCAQSADERAWQILDHGVHDTNPLKRIQAVQAMGVLRPDAKIASELEGALVDKETGVREAACVALGAMKSTTSIPRLQAALEDRAPEVVFAAAKALYAMGDPKGREVMEAVLIGEQSDASGFVTSSIRSMKLKLHDVKGLTLLGVESGAGLAVPFGGVAVPVAVGLVQDNQASGKTAAAILLATDTSEDSLQALRQALTEKNWTVRAAAARAIAIRDATSLYDDVAPLLDDKREEVQYSASASLIRLKQPVPRIATSRVANKKR